MQQIQVGDRVKVLKRAVSRDPNGMGEGKKWDNVWVPPMGECIGKEYVVCAINEDDGAYLRESSKGGTYEYAFPLNVLELVEEMVAA